jgi:hypothetical protein
VVEQLLFQYSPRLNEQAAVNGLVAHSHALAFGIRGLQPSGNLFGRPVPEQFTCDDVLQLAVHGKKTPFSVATLLPRLSGPHHGRQVYPSLRATGPARKNA